MPRTLLDNEELARVIAAIVSERGRDYVERLLEKCHEYPTTVDPAGEWLQPYEKFFRKLVSYGDFHVHFRYFLCDGDTIVASDVQFKRVQLVILQAILRVSRAKGAFSGH